MRRYYLAVAWLAVMVAMIASVVYGATYEYKFPITITDTSNTTRTYVPVVLGFTGQTLINAGKINASGNDTNIQEAENNREFTMGTTHITTVLPLLPSGGSVTTDLYTGYSPEQSTFSMVWGSGGYVTRADDAAIEPGDNWSLTIEDCYIDTTTTGNITRKDDAFYLHVPVAGNLTAQIYGTSVNVSALVSSGEHDIELSYTPSSTSVIQELHPSVLLVHSGRRGGQRFNNVAIGTVIDSVQFYLGKNGSPTGTGYVRVRSVADDSIIGTIGSIDVSTLSGDWEEFTNNVTVNATEDIRVVFEYASGNSTNSVQVYLNNANVCDGVFTSYNAVWTDTASWDAAIRYYTGINTLELDVDGSTSSTTANISIPNTANDFIIGSDITPYMGSWKLAIDGVDTVHYEPTAIISGTTLPDRAGTAQNGVITWGSNTNMSLFYGEMESSESMTLEGADEGFDMPDSEVPSTWFADCEAGADLPFYSFVNDAATNSGVPVCTIYFLITIGIAFAVCLLIIVGTRSALLGVLGMVIILFVGSSMTIIPMWIPFSVMIVDFGIMFLYKQVSY